MEFSIFVSISSPAQESPVISTAEDGITISNTASSVSVLKNQYCSQTR
jgi:hypothetical protein